MSINPRDILSIEEVAEATRTPLATLRFWRANDPSRGPKSFKVGRRVRYLRSDVDAWLQQQYGASPAGSDVDFARHQTMVRAVAVLVDEIAPMPQERAEAVVEHLIANGANFEAVSR